jgi:C4-dicarboxylate-specific signal transduction histidine kinase
MDLAGLGLTAEALSHEIANVADQLAQRIKAISPVVSRANVDARIGEFVEYVRAAVAALRKQLAHLAPTLRFARERKDKFDVRDFIGATAEYFRDRLSDKGIALRVEVGSEELAVKTSRGKLTQVMDNLVLNSEYWLTEQHRRTAEGQRWIKIRLRPPHVLVSDSGPGIDPSVESKLFQPFVTLKPKGRGLGLFVVRQLLDSMGCSISLRSDRNQAGRRYVFDLDLSGAADDDRAADG